MGLPPLSSPCVHSVPSWNAEKNSQTNLGGQGEGEGGKVLFHKQESFHACKDLLKHYIKQNPQILFFKIRSTDHSYMLSHVDRVRWFLYPQLTPSACKWAWVICKPWPHWVVVRRVTIWWANIRYPWPFGLSKSYRSILQRMRTWEASKRRGVHWVL